LLDVSSFDTVITAGTTSNNFESFVNVTGSTTAGVVVSPSIGFQVSFPYKPSKLIAVTFASTTAVTPFSHISSVEIFTVNGVFV
jgi:hypothetical protein